MKIEIMVSDELVDLIHKYVEVTNEYGKSTEFIFGEYELIDFDYAVKYIVDHVGMSENNIEADMKEMKKLTRSNLKASQPNGQEVDKGGRPSKLTKLEEVSMVTEYMQCEKVESLAIKYSVSVRTVNRVIKKYRDSMDEEMIRIKKSVSDSNEN